MIEDPIQKLPAPFQTICRAFLNWWDDLMMQAVMSLIWSLSWLTVILGPPVTFGIYFVESQYIQGENPGLRGLWEGSRRYFWKSWLWMLSNLFVEGLLYASARAYLQFEGVWMEVPRNLLILNAVAWAAIQFYTLPILMIQDRKSLREAWRNSLLLTLASPLYLLVLFLFLGLSGVFSLLLIFPTVLGYFTLLSILANQAVRDRLETFRAASSSSPDRRQNERTEYFTK
jgi:uncharacterized membrane protein YesL